MFRVESCDRLQPRVISETALQTAEIGRTMDLPLTDEVKVKIVRTDR